MIEPERIDDYPAIADLAWRAKRRMPRFAWEYLDSGTGRENLLARNRSALDEVRLVPRFLRGPIAADTQTSLLGREYSAPFGIAPVAQTGMMWPGGEAMLAATAKRRNLPYCLSTVSVAPPEAIGPLTDGRGWFQLYPMADREICNDIMARAEAAGFETLVVTVDASVLSMRERQRRAGIKLPPRTDLATIAQILARPAWLRGVLKHGAPKIGLMEKYAASNSTTKQALVLRDQLVDVLDWDYLREIRDVWRGPIVLKGLLHEGDAVAAADAGMDAIVVSNHGGRQFDAAPASIEALPAIAQAIGGKVPLLFDSGVRGGLDILRALALGADFVLLGRAFIYGIAALGEAGGDHVADLLKFDLINNMKQLGIERPVDARELLADRA